MAILCFEGPSAAGKTTAAKALAGAAGAYVVPDVNELFERPPNEPPEWYFERQIDRWTLATARTENERLVVLDGDPFQPLWYIWAYNYAGWQTLEFMESFYRPRLFSGDIGFPDQYVVFGASLQGLRARKEADRTRRRRNFDLHLQFIEPQHRYFEAMKHFSSERVFLINAQHTNQTVSTVMAAARQARREERPVELFDHLITWLREQPPPVPK